MGNKTKKSFNFRAFVSVLAGFSFVSMAVTGLVLFFTPSCRIARESSWIFWGHDKDQWVAIHVWFSIAFVIASLFHIYLNWTALTSYFKTKLHQGFAFRAEWILVLLICGIFYIGTIREVVPFSSLIAWKETFKHGGTGSAEQGRHFGQVGMHVLERQFTLDAEDKALDKCEDEKHTKQQNGHRAGRGTGQKTLKEFCTDEGINLPRVVEQLSRAGFTAKETMTMREIADEFGMHPSELRGILNDRQ